MSEQGIHDEMFKSKYQIILIYISLNFLETKHEILFFLIKLVL